MEFKREDSACIFTVPDRINVKQQLEFYSTVGGLSGAEMWERMWEGAKNLIQDWQCELMPDIDTDLTTIDNPEIAGILIWASARVNAHMGGLKSIPKA
jgi:hypothetical protein